MLQTKIYNLKKYYKLNKFFQTDLDKFSITYIKNNSELFTMNKIIKTSEIFDIIKEEYLNIYFLNIKNIFIIHLDNEILLDDFEYLYHNSNYLFKVYKTQDHKFHLFCISKEEQQPTHFINILNGNESNYKYLFLYHIYGNILIMNKKYNQKQHTYTFLKTIGKGVCDQLINSKINSIIQLINNSQYLPSHYLNI